MSRFADPKATKRFVLPGPCACPNQPHDEDWMEVRTQLGTADLLKIEDAGSGIDRLEVMVVAWNLRDDDGSEAPVDRDHLERLYFDAALFKAFDAWTNEHVKVVALPNGSGAPSRNGSRVSAGPARMTRPKT